MGKRSKARGTRPSRVVIVKIDIHDSPTWWAEVVPLSYSRLSAAGGPAQREGIITDPADVLFADDAQSLVDTVQDALQRVTDRYDRPAAAMWQLNGDPLAWLLLVERLQLRITELRL